MGDVLLKGEMDIIALEHNLGPRQDLHLNIRRLFKSSSRHFYSLYVSACSEAVLLSLINYGITHINILFI